ncbi:MAG: SRPBCC family protein [Anaerolineae bacterium]|nr:SRPBCC family protein [Anaerolineae bacterium]
MAKVVKSITIDAPVEKVFAYLGDPMNLPEFWPSMVEVTDVEPLPTGGSNFRWVYKMAGVRFEGATEQVEYVANQRTVSKNEGGVSSTITWAFEPTDGGTEVVFDADYTVHLPVLRRLAEAFLVKQNEHEAELLLANLKARMEA